MQREAITLPWIGMAEAHIYWKFSRVKTCSVLYQEMKFCVRTTTQLISYSEQKQVTWNSYCILFYPTIVKRMFKTFLLASESTKWELFIFRVLRFKKLFLCRRKIQLVTSLLIQAESWNVYNRTFSHRVCAGVSSSHVGVFAMPSNYECPVEGKQWVWK